MENNYKITVVGLGYVGLPLAVEFSKKYKTVGIDINKSRIKELNSFNDSTCEVCTEELKNQISNSWNEFKTKRNGLFLKTEIDTKFNTDFYIITVPTPIDTKNRPNLKPLFKASQTVGKNLKKDNIVIYESTVYPGATEEDCVPILEKYSNLKFNKDFFVGYSPERINPGDKMRKINDIVKVTSGSTKTTAKKIDFLYKSIITAGTFMASSIKVAEAAKVIENSQRDINIAFINELSKIFNKMHIDTHEVLEAASTKWNFLNFKPGLVGGHCIGVDPYYLAEKAMSLGYNPEIILAGRRLNDSMGRYVVSEVIKLMINKNISVSKESKVLILGLTFKENCPDIRNSKVVDIYHEFLKHKIKASIYDPLANPNEVKNELDIELISDIKSKFDVIIHAVSHSEFESMDLNKILNGEGVIYDVKGNLNKKLINGRL